MSTRPNKELLNRSYLVYFSLTLLGLAIIGKALLYRLQKVLSYEKKQKV